MRAGGYFEYRVEIRNSSKTTDHVVRVTNPADVIDIGGESLRRNTRSVKVPKQTTVLVPFFQPSIETYGGGIGVAIDGVPQEDAVLISSPFSGRSGFSSGSAAELSVLTSRSIEQDYKDSVRAAHMDAVCFFRSELPTRLWSTEWLGYTAYDVVLMTQQEAADLPPDILLALRRYVEAGGNYLIQGDSDDLSKLIPAGFSKTPIPTTAAGLGQIGFGLAGRCPPELPWPRQIMSTRPATPVAPDSDELRVTNKSSIPVRGVLAMVILFAIIIGPLNIWLLARKQKKMWLWWNVPLISLVTSLLIFGFSLASEGIRGRGRTALITVLDETSHRATTLGYISYYCPLTPSDGLHFSYDTSVARMNNEARFTWRSRTGRPKTLDWTRDQHLESGWVLPRVPVCFAVVKNESRRERLIVRPNPAGGVSIVNGLGVVIDSLHYLDAQGVLHTGSNIQDGAEQTLTSTSEITTAATSGLVSLHELYAQSWESSISLLNNSPKACLVPGSYLAAVKKNPFLEDPLPASPQSGNIGFIYGVGMGASDGN